MQTVKRQTRSGLAAVIGSSATNYFGKETEMNVNTETVRQLAFDISSASTNVEILIQQILEKADSVAASTNVGSEAIGAISCFGECVLRLMGVVSQQNDKLLQMTYGVPACVN